MRLIVAGSRTITDAALVWCVALTAPAVAALAAPVTAQPTTIADTVSVSVEDGLRYALRGEVPHNLGAQLILRAGATDNRALAPLLREIVARPASVRFGAGRSWERQTAAALHVLWLQGEPPGYFVGLVRGWPADYMRAYEAALVLARTPTPEVLALLDEVHRASVQRGRNDRIGGALSHVNYVAHKVSEYEALATPEARARVAIEVAARCWSPYIETHFTRLSRSGWVDIDIRDPYTVVRWGWFLSLSREHPAAVAGAIRSYVADARGRYTPEEVADLPVCLRDLSPASVRELLPPEP